jgi:hypothetical protein
MPDAVGPVAAGGADIGLAVAGMWLVGSAAVPDSPAAERLAAGLLLVVGAAWLLMAQPLLGVSLVGHAIVLRLVFAGAVLAAVAVRRPRLWAGGVRPLTLAAAAVVAIGVAYPAWRTPTDLLPGSDIQWHEGWIRQVAGGAPAPTGLYTDVPNAYPWLLHALGAAVMQGFGAGMATTLLVLEGIMLLGLGLGTWLLARELWLSEAAAGWAVVLALGGGGLGLLWSHGPAAVLTVGVGAPRNVPAGLAPFRAGIARYGGDFLLSPGPTPALGNVPPAEPRDFGLALVPLALWLFLRAVRRRSPAAGAVAGATLGFVLLLSPIAAAVAAACALVLSIRAPARVVAVAGAGVAVVVALWVLPLAWHYHRLGGFVKTTRAPPETITLSAAAVTLAAVLVLAAVGAVSGAIRRGEVDRRAIGVLVAVPLVIYAASTLASGGGGALPAVSRSVRYLPPVGLILVFPAALGAVAAVRATRRAAPYAAVVLGALCVASPVAAAVGMSRAVAWSEGHPVVACGPSTPLDSHDTVAVVPVRGEGQNAEEAVALSLFAGTGAHQLYVPRPRIRYRDIFRHIPPQRDRKATALAIGAGAAPRGGVTTVLAPAAAPVAGDGLVRAAGCHLDPYALGRFYDVDYTLYRVVR